MVNSVQAKCPTNNMFSVEIAESRQSQSAWKLPSSLATLNRKIYSSSSHGKRCWGITTQHIGFICVFSSDLISTCWLYWLNRKGSVHQDYGLLLFPRIGLTVVGSSAQKGALASKVKSSPDWPARERESQWKGLSSRTSKGGHQWKADNVSLAHHKTNRLNIDESGDTWFLESWNCRKSRNCLFFLETINDDGGSLSPICNLFSGWLFERSNQE